MSIEPSPVELNVENDAAQHNIIRPQYIAVRKGGSVQNCIFQNWDDAKYHLAGPDAQYSIFDSISDAVKYAFHTDLPAVDDNDININSVTNLNASPVMNNINDSILESMAAENLMEQILPSTSNLLRMPQVHDDFISLAHEAAAAMDREEHAHLGLTHDVPHSQHVLEGHGMADGEGNGDGGLACAMHSINNAALPNVPLADPQLLELSSVQNQTQPQSQLTATSRKQKRGVKRKNDDKIRSRETKREKEWNTKYNLLANYVAQHGTSSVPIKPENNVLNAWISQQRIAYRKLQQDGDSKLLASQVQKLHDMGLKFTAKRRYATWEQRLEELKAFKEANGHARVPVNDPKLGQWVHSQRREYKKYINNDPKTKMTQDKLRQMIEIGFVFEVAKKTQQYDSRSNAKSWEDRFEELKDFKETFGHTVVPQHYPNLGWWVNTQRKERKKLKAGKKTPLTTERCLMLTEIGFVFDASNKRGTNYGYDD